MSAGANAANSSIAAATANKITPEGVGAAGVVVTIPDFEITVGSDLDLNGKSLQITLDTPMVAANMPVTLTDKTCAKDTNISAINYAGLTNGGLTANYTITSVDAEVMTACIIVASGIDVLASDLTTAGIDATSSFTLIGSGVSQSTAVEVLDLTATQYSLKVDEAANAKIDVNQDREAFEGGIKDEIKFTVKDLATAADTVGATSPSLEITVTGDFSWADNPLTAAFDPTAANSGLLPVKINNATFVAAKSDATQLVFSDTAIRAQYVLEMLPLVDKNLADDDATDDVRAVQVPPQAFTVGVKVSYTDAALDKAGSAAAAAGSATLAAAASGSHTLNGASTKIFAVPFGAEVESHSIFVSNTGTSTGAITGSMAWNGNTAVTFSLGNVEAGANKYLDIMGALEALSEKPAFGRADITLTVNSPEADITFTAAYNTATGRANLFMQEQATMATLSSAAATSAATADSVADVVCANLAAGADADGAGFTALANTYYVKTACP
jgi:hypothetical protein